MEEKINAGYKLFVELNKETRQLDGVYFRQTKGASTKIVTQPKELNFLQILTTVINELEEGYILEVGKEDTKYYASITEEANNIEKRKSIAYDDYCLNTLVELESKLTMKPSRENILS